MVASGWLKHFVGSRPFKLFPSDPSLSAFLCRSLSDFPTTRLGILILALVGGSHFYILSMFYFILRGSLLRVAHFYEIAWV